MTQEEIIRDFYRLSDAYHMWSIRELDAERINEEQVEVGWTAIGKLETEVLDIFSAKEKHLE